MADTTAILVPVDGSENSDRAVKYAVGLAKAVPGTVLHLLNVQASVGSLVTMFVPKANVDAHHREEGEKALASAVKICADAGVDTKTHISVGRPGPVVAEFARRLGAKSLAVGTRGHTGVGGSLLGSVAQDIVANVDVPVCLVK
ncbi:universal stress protein [Reyranella sp. CPCC 100927]|uniref:universal stress protein n=1 Tax=Reyranella sp. CPCC 100927 TaxID=2599616 RepID=UPI0011B4BE17|nr:universal stress protein [Reyranella sp. CPCC 100927]TWT06015.1 universal stress protein [Reyranella sp. CPCC 100927]